GHQRRGLGVDLARLQAETAIDAVRAVPEAAVRDPHRADLDLDPQLARSLPRDLGAPGDRMGGVWVAVWITPWPVLAGDGKLELEALVMALEIAIGDRPVLPHPVARPDLKVRRVNARAVAGVMDHRTADPVAGVVLAELHRIRSADHPFLGPIELVRAGLVRYPVLVRIPERSLLQHHHLPTAAGEALRQRPAPGAGADDHQIDGVVIVIAGHALRGYRATMHVEQKGRVVLRRAQPTSGERAEPVSEAHVPSTPRSCVSATGSRSNAGAPSQFSLWPTPRRA